MTLISADHISKDYQVGEMTVHALQDVSFEIEPASFVSFVGPSGSGKTTLLNLLGCLDKPTKGALTVADTEITGSDAPLQRGSALFDSNYGRVNPMRDYLYLRIVQKEPFDMLYFNPAITTILNLNDGSFTISPEILYTRIKNLELRMKTSVITGAKDSEYREKPFDYRLEFRAGYYF